MRRSPTSPYPSSSSSPPPPPPPPPPPFPGASPDGRLFVFSCPHGLIVVFRHQTGPPQPMYSLTIHQGPWPTVMNGAGARGRQCGDRLRRTGLERGEQCANPTGPFSTYSCTIHYEP